MNDFFANLLELWGAFYLGQFSDDLYDNNLYVGIGLLILIVPLVILAIYYITASSARNKVWHWLAVLLSSSILTSLIACFMADGQLQGVYSQSASDTLPWGWSELLSFFFVSLIITIVIGFIYSMGLKYINANTRKCPF